MKKGFTLVEMMVAVSIFAIVALSATSAFLMADRINKRAQAMKVVVDNLHFALNSMAFNLKQGGLYHCIKDDSSLSLGSAPDKALFSIPEDCQPEAGGGGGGPAIAFVSPKSGADGKAMIYWVTEDPGAENVKRIFYSEEDDFGMTEFIPLTITNLEINQMRFYSHNALVGGVPRVFITLDGLAKLGNDQAEFNLQTVISERL